MASNYSCLHVLFGTTARIFPPGTLPIPKDPKLGREPILSSTQGAAMASVSPA